MLKVFHACLRTVLYLCSRGADINAKDRDLETPLFIAANGGFLETCRALAELGANLETVWIKTC